MSQLSLGKPKEHGETAAVNLELNGKNNTPWVIVKGGAKLRTGSHTKYNYKHYIGLEIDTLV